MARRIAPACYACGTNVRSMAEHLASETHRRRTTSVRSSGPAGSHPYTPPAILPRSDAAYDAMLEERALSALPPSIDDVFPVEIMEPAPEPDPAERGYRPAPCERCGATFRTDAGRAWHVSRNVRCERWRPARMRRAS